MKPEVILLGSTKKNHYMYFILTYCVFWESEQLMLTQVVGNVFHDWKGVLTDSLSSQHSSLITQ